MLRVFENGVLATKVATTLDKDGEPLVRARDVAGSLGYANLDKAIRVHVGERYKVRVLQVPPIWQGPEIIWLGQFSFANLVYTSLFFAQSYPLRES